ncbi:MAG: sensor histidine kinase [Fretibacterium sp.]|nr:sensor histidine kinase [Fretibacterium sp.]
MLSGIRGALWGSSRPKHHFLAFLICALILPSVIVFLVAVWSMVSQERAMEAAVSSYVQDLAESMAYHMSSNTRLGALPFLSDMTGYPFFSWGPSIPGWVALISLDGRVIMASPGAMNIAAIWRKNLPIGKAARVEDKEGAQYTLAIYPLTGGEGYVVAAVSWDQLLGGVVRVARMWPVLIVLVTFGSFWAICLLWSRLILPLKSLVGEINNLRVGKDVPGELSRGAVKEIESVQDALKRFAQAAVERDTLRNSYVQDIVRVQEKERVDMAREIHDGPLQDITALLQQIHMSLDEAEQQKQNTDPSSHLSSLARIKRVEGLAKTVVRELRSLCDELAPPWVDLGLTETLTELAERLSQNYDIQVSVDVEDSEDDSDCRNVRDLDVGPETTLSFLRILQEAVSNAVRHGEATEVRAALSLGKENDSEQLRLDIWDNGKGFDANINHETLRLQGHRGLANMTERMSLMGGTLTITSEPGKGTHIIAVLPLTADAAS